MFRLPGFRPENVLTVQLSLDFARYTANEKIREASDAMGRSYGLELWYDVSVPASQIDAYVADAGRRIAALDPAMELHVIGISPTATCT